MPTDLNSNADQTLSQRIAGELRTAIHCGDYLPGHRLPSSRVLMREYGVARQTVQNAFDILRGEGLTVTRAGAGTFVRDIPSVLQLTRNRLERSARITGRDPAATDALTSSAVASSTATTRTEPADEHTADALGLLPGEELLVQERIMHANGEPVQLATSRLPKKLAAALSGTTTGTLAEAINGKAENPAGLATNPAGLATAAVHDRTDGASTAAINGARMPAGTNGPAGTGPITDTGSTTTAPGSGPTTAPPDTDTGSVSADSVDARLTGAGCVLDHFVEYVSTRPAKPAEASSLMLATGAPVLCVTRIAFDQRGTAVELNDMVLSGERYQLVYELHAD